MNPLVERLGWVLVHSLWQFALVALLAGVISRAMRRSSSAARYGVHVVAMGVMVVVPLVTWLISRDDLASRAALTPGEVPRVATSSRPEPSFHSETTEGLTPNGARAASGKALAAGQSPENVDPESPVASAIPLKVSAGALMPSARQEDVALSLRIKVALQPWLTWIVAVWCIGVGVGSLRPLLGWHTLWRLKRVGVSPASEEVFDVLRRVSERLQLRRAVSVLQSTLAQVPVVVGYLRPVVLLPVSLMTSLPAEQLEAILAHELAHVRRHDFVVNLLQTLVETFFFYHPAVWWLSHQIRVEREHCCDDLVVASFGNRVEYGRALLAIEELRGGSSVLALGVADGSLLSRIRRITGIRNEHAANERWPAALLGLAVIGATTAMSMSWSLAAKDEIKKEPKPDRYVAELPNGVRVEFVGLAAMEAEPKTWWKPDGSPLNEVPKYGNEMLRVAGQEVRRALLRVHGDKVSYLDVTASGMSSVILAEPPGSGGSFIRIGGQYAFPPGQKTGRFEVGIATQQQSPDRFLNAKGERVTFVRRANVARRSGALVVDGVDPGQLLDSNSPRGLKPPTRQQPGALLVDAAGGSEPATVEIGELTTIADGIAEDIEVVSIAAPLHKPDSFNGRPVLSPEKEAENKVLSQQTQLTWRAPNVPKPMNLELVLIDVHGQQHRHTSLGMGIENVAPNGIPHWGDFERFFRFDVPLARVAGFEYRVRPYQHWVTFDNVALNPGEMTDVKVQVESAPEPRAGRGSPDPALGPTEELPTSDNGSKESDKADGDLRSNPAAGSGEPRRAQPDKPAPAAGAERSAVEARILEELERPTSLEIYGLTLNDVVALVAKQHRIPIVMDVAALSELNVRQDVASSRTLKDVKLRNALKIILEDLGGKLLALVVEEDVLKITAAKTPEAAEAIKLANQRIETELRNTTEIALSDTTLSDVIQYLSDYHDISIQLHPSVQAAAETPITATMNASELADALALILHESKLSSCIDHGVLLIANPEEIRKRAGPIPRGFADDLAKLEKADASVRWFALLRGVVEESDSAAIPKLTVLLGSDDVVIQRWTARALVPFGNKARTAQPGLEKLTRSKERRVAFAAWQALIEIGREDLSTLPLLLSALDREDESLTNRWIALIWRFDRKVWRELAAKYATLSIPVRRTLASSKFGDHAFVVLPLSDPDLETRRRALRRSFLDASQWTVSQREEFETVLVTRLKDLDAESRVLAAGQLLNINQSVDTAVTTILAEASHEPGRDVLRRCVASTNFLFLNGQQQWDEPCRSESESTRNAARQTLAIICRHYQTTRDDHFIIWGSNRGGWCTRLSPLTEKPQVGEPIKLKLELDNKNKKRPAKFTFSQPARTSLVVIGPDGREMSPINRDRQPYDTLIVAEPHKPVVLIEGLDLAAEYPIKQPGTYLVQWTHYGQPTKSVDGQPLLPNSNVLTIEVAEPAKVGGLRPLNREINVVNRELNQALDAKGKVASPADLRLVGDEVSADGIELRPLTRLEELDLTHTRITDVGLTTIEQMPHLKTLELNRHPEWYLKQQLTDACMKSILRLPKLETLSLSGKITDSGLEQLGRLPKLKSLMLMSTEVTGDGLGALKDSPIESLIIPEQLMGDPALKHLQKYRVLKRIDIIGKSFRESEMDEWLRQLPEVDLGFSS